GRLGHRRLRPTLHQLRRPLRPRVPRQHVHDEQSTVSFRRRRLPGQLHRRLDEPAGRLRLWDFRTALCQLRRPPRPRVPRQHVHDGQSNFSVRRPRFLRQLLGRLVDPPGGPLVRRFRPPLLRLRNPPRITIRLLLSSPTPLPTSLSSARATLRTAPALAFSASATPAPASPSAPSSASTRTRRALSLVPPSPPTPPATSSSSGRATCRTPRCWRSSASVTARSCPSS